MLTTRPSFSVPSRLALQNASLDNEGGLMSMDITDYLGLPRGLLYKWSCPVFLLESGITPPDYR